MSNPDTILQLGVAPVRIDLLSSLDGIESFEQAWQRREDARYGSVDTHYISLDDLLAAKQSAGRDQDRADLENLEQARKAR